MPPRGGAYFRSCEYFAQRQFADGDSIFTDQTEAKKLVADFLTQYAALVKNKKTDVEGVGNGVFLSCMEAQKEHKQKGMPKGITPQGPQIDS